MTDQYSDLYTDGYGGEIELPPVVKPLPDYATVRLVGSNGQSVTLLDSAEDLMREPGGSGWGMVPVVNSWFEGAGDGARLRGTRRTTRELSIPVSAFGMNRQGVEMQIRRLTNTIHDPFKVFLDYQDGRSYWIDAVYEGGASGQYGNNPTRQNKLPIVLTCPDPYWTSVQAQTFIVNPVLGDPFLPELSGLHVSSSVAQGLVTVTNVGDVTSRPTWTIHGPGSNLTIKHNGRGLVLEKTLTSTDRVYIAFIENGWTIKDQNGANLYEFLGDAPYFPELPPGTSIIEVTMIDATADTTIQAIYPERREVLY